MGAMLATTVVASGVLVGPAHAALPTGGITRVSPDGSAMSAQMDDSGRIVAYLQGSTHHVMLSDGGNNSRLVADAQARDLAISADGGTIAFSTDRSLLAGDTDALSDVYASDRAGNLRLVSGAIAANSGAFSPSVNGNGAVIAFSAGALVPANGIRSIFVVDGGNMAQVPVDNGGADSVNPSISNDARTVAFELAGSGAAGVYLWDRGTPKAARATGGFRGSRPSISGNGRVVAFQVDNNVVVTDRDGASSIAPALGANPSLSADGNVVAFQSSDALDDNGDMNGTDGAGNPIRRDFNNKDDVLAWGWRQQRSLFRASGKADWFTPNGGSFSPSVSADGGIVAFESDTGDFGNGLVGSSRNIFLRVPGGPLSPGGPSVGPGPGPGSNEIHLPAIPSRYWLTAGDGGVFSFGSSTMPASFFGSTGNIKLAQPIVGMAATPSGKGYWFVASDGGIFSFGDAKFFGSTGNIKLAKPIVGMASTPSGNGYWMVASDGGIFSFGDAKFFGSTGNIKLAKPIVGMASTPSGNGYWMVASDGGIFSFGDAKFFGSTGNIKLAKPIVGMAATRTGQGYWFVASDGGIFSYGDAGFNGSTGNIKLAKPIVGMAAFS
jgi:Tol biopolymer transport system component/ribosomal protein L24E